MFNNGTRVLRLAIGGAVFALVAFLAIGIASAQGVPRSWVASPDVYKVVAENDQYLVIEVTWKPGQRDQLHSHPVSATYWLTDCTRRIYAADGTVLSQGTRLAGSAFVQPAIPAHTFENTGKSDCKLIMFEPK